MVKKGRERKVRKVNKPKTAPKKKTAKGKKLALWQCDA